MSGIPAYRSRTHAEALADVGEEPRRVDRGRGTHQDRPRRARWALEKTERAADHRRLEGEVLECAERFVVRAGDGEWIVQQRDDVRRERYAETREADALDRRPAAQRLRDGLGERCVLRGERRRVGFGERDVHGDVGRHEAQRDAAGQHTPRGDRIAAQVVVDPRRDAVAADVRRADVAAHHRQPRDAACEAGIAVERRTEVGERADRDELERLAAIEEAQQRRDRRLVADRAAGAAGNELGLEAEPHERAVAERSPAAGVHGHVAAPAECQQPCRDARAQRGVVGDRRHRHQLELRRRQRQRQSDGIVAVRADVGVENDAPHGGHPSARRGADQAARKAKRSRSSSASRPMAAAS